MAMPMRMPRCFLSSRPFGEGYPLGINVSVSVSAYSKCIRAKRVIVFNLHDIRRVTVRRYALLMHHLCVHRYGSDDWRGSFHRHVIPFDDNDGGGGGGAVVARRILVHLKGINRPIRLHKRLGVLPDVFLTSARLRRASGLLGPDGAGPVAAEGGVEDDVVVLEMPVDVAVVATEEARGGGTPSRGVGVGTRDIAGDAVAREEPDVDGGAGPFHGVNTAAGGVERSAVTVRSLGFAIAAETAVATGAGEGAAGTGVHGYLILGLMVDTLDDVDFTAVRPGVGSVSRYRGKQAHGCSPVGTRHPAVKVLSASKVLNVDRIHSQCGPHATSTAGHVGEIEDNQAVGVLCFACQPDTVAPSSRSDVDVIHAPGHLAVADVVQILGVGSGSINIVDIAMSRVIELVLLLSIHPDQSDCPNVRYRS